jgi:transcriptional regulator
MYIPKAFEISDEKVIHEFIRQRSFGQLISSVNGRLFSSHIPFLLSADATHVYAHLAKQNPQWSGLAGQEVLLTIQGEHGYISPSWYETPGVPTWNYEAVHIYGYCRIIDDLSILKDILGELTEKYEAKLEVPWEKNYRSEMLNAIIGIKLSITEIQCKFKMSQNKSSEDRDKIRHSLTSAGQYDLAKLIR